MKYHLIDSDETYTIARYADTQYAWEYSSVHYNIFPKYQAVYVQALLSNIWFLAPDSNQNALIRGELGFEGNWEIEVWVTTEKSIKIRVSSPLWAQSTADRWQRAIIANSVSIPLCNHGESSPLT